MSNIDVDYLAQIIRQVDGNHDLGAGALAEAILDRLPAPQVIHTVTDLEALDPLTVVYTPDRDMPACAGDFLDDIRYDPDYADDLLAVKVASGAHLRACREALEGGAG